MTKLMSFRHQGREKVGELEGSALHVLGAPSMLDLIADGGAERTGEIVPLADAAVIAPIPRPCRNIFCIGKNYRDHVAEFVKSGFDATAREDLPEYPIVFTKAADAVIGPGDGIAYPAGLSDMVDYEGEIGVVIGRLCKKVSRADALSHIFGFTLINDVTARDLQKRHVQWFIGKSLDSFCPMGPAIVTADELAADDIAIECRVNGELRQSGNTRDLIFDMAALIETLSAGITLYPGDVIATGTPSGVGAGFSPPKFLKPGDVVEVSSPAIGVLANRVV